MRYNLNRFAKIITPTLLVYDAFVDTSRCHRVGFGGLDTCKAFVMTEVEVGFHPSNSHVTLTVFIRIQRSWVDVNVWIKLLDGDVVASRLKKLANR